MAVADGDLVLGAGFGGGARVQVYDGLLGKPVRDFLAFEDKFRGGVSVAAGNVTGDGVADIAVGAGFSGGPRVRVFDGLTGKVVRDLFVYETDFRGGVSVGVGDSNGDGFADLIVGAGPRGGPRMRVISGADSRGLRDYFVGDVNARNGAAVGVSDLDGNGLADVSTGSVPRTIDYAYDYDGLLADAREGAEVVRYVWDRSLGVPQILEERDGGNALLRRYESDGFNVTRVREANGSQFYYQRDQLGSVRAVRDAAGAVVASYRYDAWGRPLGATPQGPGYTNGWTDADTGLVYLRSRWYLPDCAAVHNPRRCAGRPGGSRQHRQPLRVCGQRPGQPHRPHGADVDRTPGGLDHQHGDLRRLRDGARQRPVAGEGQLFQIGVAVAPVFLADRHHRRTERQLRHRSGFPSQRDRRP